jgi:hypothetical protein
MGIFSTTTTLVVPEICSKIRELKGICLTYLEMILKSYSENRKGFNSQLVGLTILIDTFIENTTDKSILGHVLNIFAVLKSTIQDEFLIQYLEEYLDENFFSKYYDAEVGKFQTTQDLTSSKLQSVERWKMIRPMSLRSPAKRPQTFNDIKEEDSDSRIFSPFNSQLLTEAKSLVELSIEEYICDGRLTSHRQSTDAERDSKHPRCAETKQRSDQEHRHDDR